MRLIKKVLFWDFNKSEGLEEFIIENNIDILISEPIQGKQDVISMLPVFAETLKNLHSQKKYLWIID